jgi:hypothetical protein
MTTHSGSPHSGTARQGEVRGAPIVRFDTPIAAKDYLTAEEWDRLAWHMHNENGPYGFSMYFIGKDDEPRVAASKTRRVAEAIQSTWRSMTEEIERPFAAVLYPTNQAFTSIWACMDVDHHDGSGGGEMHAEWVIRKLLAVLFKPKDPRRQDIAWIFESSGRGYHLYLLSPDQLPVKKWRQLMHGMLAEAGLKGADGIELYPVATGKRKGVRLPGSANPKTWNPAAGSYLVSRFMAVAGLKVLIDGLPELFNKRGFSLSLKGVDRGEEIGRDRKDDRPAPWTEHTDASRLLSRYAISAPSTRHNQLASLVGDGFWHFSREVLWQIVAQQYAGAVPRCESDLGEHRKDFDSLHEGLMVQLKGELTPDEQAIWAKLKTPDARAAFVIVRNFARLARISGKYGSDRSFPFSGLDLACRLQIGVKNAYNLRMRLIGLGFLEKVSECIRGKKAEYFIWLLASSIGNRA